MTVSEFAKKHNALSIIIQLAAFAVLFAVSKLFLGKVYLFEWTARNYYLCIWAAACLFSFFGKNIIGASITAGTILGVPIGELIGSYIRTVNMSRITEDTDPQREAFLSLHHGWFIWLVTISAAFVTGVLITVLKGKRKKVK